MTEPCCLPSLCDFRVERVRFWLYHIKMAKLNGEDPVESAQAYASPRGERFMGRVQCSGHRDNGAELAVAAIMEKIEAGFSVHEPEKIAKALCPHAVPECAIIGSQRDHHA